jgi:hypothetical protein
MARSYLSETETGDTAGDFGKTAHVQRQGLAGVPLPLPILIEPPSNGAPSSAQTD